MSGLPPEEALGYRWAQAVHPEDRDRALQEWQAANGKTGRLTTEFRLQRPDGVIRWVFVNVDAVTGPDGSYDGAVGAGVDITELKEAEAELRRGKEALRVLLNANADAAAMLDLDFRFLEISDRIAGDFGMAQTEMLGRSILEFTPDELREPRAALLREVVTTKSSRAVIDEHDGRVFETRVLPIEGAAGEPERLAVFTTDITQRRAAELATAENEKRLRKVVENMPVILDAFDESGAIVAWNAEAERVTGYSADEIVGNPRALELLYPDPEYREVMLNSWMSRGRNYRDWEWEICCKDGSTRIIAWSDISDYMPIPGWHSWGVGVDVTDRRRSEQKLRESERRLTEAQRVGNIGFWDWDIANGNLYWSDEIYRIFGLSRQSFGATYEAFLN
ncbi:MAG TPA: PAS domain S-box protein, partial [candidate division Zixibacteria bacterium]|nr:PAS domain S-box protein [candidate division Zixibacteria bacterium]